MRRLAVLLVLLWATTASAVDPNIVIIYVDDLAQGGVSAYGTGIGGRANTPNIDSIATAGVRFTNSFNLMPLCTPSRAILYTGRPSWSTGIVDNSATLDDTIQTTMDVLQAGGYATAFFGKWQTPPMTAQNLGWSYRSICTEAECGAYVDPAMANATGSTTALGAPATVTGYVTDIVTDQAIAWLAARTVGTPYFVVLSHKAPHDPIIPGTIANGSAADDNGDLDGVVFTEPSSLNDARFGRAAHVREWTSVALDEFTAWTSAPYSTTYAKPQPGGSVDTDPERIAFWFQEYTRDYHETIQALDRNVGELLTAIAADAEAANTYVFFISDNGLVLGEHQLSRKRIIYDQSASMVLIAKGPAITAGQVKTEMVSNLDLAPTFVALSGEAEPAAMVGRSLMDLLPGPPSPAWRTGTYFQNNNSSEAVERHAAYVTSRYKLIRWFGAYSTGGPEWELIDRLYDPNELDNMYANPDYANDIADLVSGMETEASALGLVKWCERRACMRGSSTSSFK